MQGKTIFTAIQIIYFANLQVLKNVLRTHCSSSLNCAKSKIPVHRVIG